MITDIKYFIKSLMLHKTETNFSLQTLNHMPSNTTKTESSPFETQFHRLVFGFIYGFKNVGQTHFLNKAVDVVGSSSLSTTVRPDLDLLQTGRWSLPRGNPLTCSK